MSQETIVSVSAILIAICALGVSIWQGHETRKNYRLSVQPFLYVYGRWANDKGIKGIILENRGVGPAIITKMEFMLNKNVRIDVLSRDSFSTFMSLVDNRIQNSRITGTNRNSIIKNEMVPPGKEIPIIFLSPVDGEDLENVQSFEHAFSGIDVRIEYQSIYKEKFSTHYEKNL